MRLNRSVRQVSGGLLVGAVLAAVGCAANVNELEGSASEARTVSAAAPDAFSALQPKKETGVDRFLAQFPEYDGRGTIIAVFDTGVDPGAPGLAVTTDGQPKVIDVIDGTGSGDVDMTTTREVSPDGTVEGLTGRTLSLGDWVAEGAEVRVGMKPGFDLASRQLLWRLRSERKDDAEPAARALIESLKRELAAWDKDNPEPDEEQFKDREDLAARLGVAEELWSSWDDTGPVYDCVLFNDGGVWRALVDTDEDGDLGEEKALTNFRDEREFATFDEQSLLNFACNIYEDGDILSIVTDCGTHGTHVAGMAAAHFPDRPELNGIAPGAQIVSVKIGDHRVGSSSLGTGQARGLRAVLDLGVDVINMSYGGSSSITDWGRTADLYRELVFDQGVVFVASAGNSGPALSTAGSPGGTTSALIGVGAAVSPEMARAQYGVREPGEELNFTWSSRGPTLDGDTGVDIAGPGAAFSPVPNWALQKHTQMNGTSMSAPSVAGGVALLISAAKQTETPYAPASIKRAMKSTARAVPGHEAWDVGAGMAQFDRAWSFMSEYGEAFDADVRYEARLRGSGFGQGARGVYLREPWEVDSPTEVRVDLSPIFPKDADNRRKVDFEVRLDIASSQPWVMASGVGVLNHGGDDLRVRVDPTGLEPGAHYAEVTCSDAERPERGVLARIPVTVIKPTEIDSEDYSSGAETLSQMPGDISRKFFAVPEGATWADVTVRRMDRDTDRLIVVHSVQLDDQRSFNTLNDEQWINLDKSDEHVISYPVLGGGTLEVALCNYWTNPGRLDYEFEIRFGGLTPSTEPGMIGGQGSTRFDVQASLGDQVLAPSGSLTALRRTVRAKDWSIEPLTEARDSLWDGMLAHELVIEYSVEFEDDHSVEFVMGGEGFQDVAHDYSSNLVYLYDANGSLVDTSAGSLEADVKEGEYRVLVHIRDEDPAALERVTSLPLMVDFEISSIGLKFHKDELAGIDGRGGFSSTDLAEGERAAVYIFAPDRGDMPDFAQPGDVLWGEMTLGELGDRLYGAGDRPAGYGVWCVVPPKQEDKPEPEPKESEDEEETDPTDELADEVFELRLAALGKMEEDAAFDALMTELRSERPDDVRLLVAEMDRAADAEDAEQADVIARAQAVIDAVDQDAVAAWNGVEHDEDAEDYDEDRAEQMERQHEALLAGLRAKAKALGGEGDEPLGEGDLEAFEDAIAELDRWTDLGDDDFDLKLRRELAAGRTGKALELLRARAGEETEDKELRERSIALMEELGWDQWAQIERRRLVLDFPPSDRPF